MVKVPPDETFKLAPLVPRMVATGEVESEFSTGVWLPFESMPTIELLKVRATEPK